MLGLHGKDWGRAVGLVMLGLGVFLVPFTLLQEALGGIRTSGPAGAALLLPGLGVSLFLSAAMILHFRPRGGRPVRWGAVAVLSFLVGLFVVFDVAAVRWVSLEHPHACGTGCGHFSHLLPGLLILVIALAWQMTWALDVVRRRTPGAQAR